MTGLLEMREKLRTFYGKYELYVTAGLKFVLGLVVFSVINGNIGYMERLNQPAAVLLLSLLCAFFPINAMVVLACGLILLHLFGLCHWAVPVFTAAVSVWKVCAQKWIQRNFDHSALFFPGAPGNAGSSRNVEGAFCIFFSIVRNSYLLLSQGGAG